MKSLERIDFPTLVRAQASPTPSFWRQKGFAQTQSLM
jgi:hypothetical protein